MKAGQVASMRVRGGGGQSYGTTHQWGACRNRVTVNDVCRVVVVAVYASVGCRVCTVDEPPC